MVATLRRHRDQSPDEQRDHFRGDEQTGRDRERFDPLRRRSARPLRPRRPRARWDLVLCRGANRRRRLMPDHSDRGPPMARKTKVRTSAMAALAATGVATWFRRRQRRDTAAIMHDLGSPRGINDAADRGSSASGDGSSASGNGSSASGDGHASGHRHLATPPRVSSRLLAHRADRSWIRARRRSSGRTP